MSEARTVRTYLERTADTVKLRILTDEELQEFCSSLDALYNEVCIIEPLRRAILAREALPETV